MSTTIPSTDAPNPSGSNIVGRVPATTQPYPDIQAIMGVLRSFSNEVTVARLARSLNVSYSTLARCKNGYWPPSITFNALRNVFNQYKHDFFGDDGALLVAAVLEHLSSQGLHTAELEAAYDIRGYEGFVNALLLKAAETTRGQSTPKGVVSQGEAEGRPDAVRAADAGAASATPGATGSNLPGTAAAAVALPASAASQPTATVVATTGATTVAGPSTAATQPTSAATQPTAVTIHQPAIPQPVATMAASQTAAATAAATAQPAATDIPPNATTMATSAGAEVRGATLASSTETSHATNVEATPQPSPWHKAAPYLPLVLVIGLGLFQAPVESMIGWMLERPVAFFALSLGIALASPVSGLLIDSPIAWMRARKREGRQDFTWKSFCLTAKYGSSKAIVPGEGRYDPSPGHLAYGTLCNVLGMLCVTSLLFALRAFPGFADYVASHSWIEYLKCCVAVGFVIAYHHATTHQSLPTPTNFGPGFNPDNYRYSRVHVWANTVHLVWVISIACALALCMLGYSVAHLQAGPLPLAVLWPFAQTALFLAYCNTSPFAKRALVPTVGSFAPGMLGMSAAMAVLTVACYQPSWQNVVALTSYGACAAFALAWQQRMRSREASAEWMQRGRTTRAYGTGMVAVLLVMLLAGLLTSSLA